MEEENKKTEGIHSTEGGEETYKCAKCGKIKKKSEGHFIYGGTTFCCEKCCKEDGEKKDNTCEFC